MVSGIGHRPPKLADVPYCYSEGFLAVLSKFVLIHLKRLRPDAVVSGMALGYDMALAKAAIALNIPLIAAVPFKGQELAWKNRNTQQIYHDLLKSAYQVVIVCPGEYAAHKLQKRNEWMVQRSHLTLALWDQSEGGTGNCVHYARDRQQGVINLWADWVSYKS